MRRSLTARSGFTLMELMVVVSIIALLAGILFPMVNSAREAARIVQCSSNLHQIDSAIKAWGQIQQVGKIPMKLPDADSWMQAVVKVTNDNRILYCPDGTASPFVAGTAPTFFSDQGWVTHNKTYTPGNGHPTPVFSPNPALFPNATTYTLSIQYHNLPSNGGALFTFTKVSSTVWKWTANRVDNGGAQGGKPLTVTWGSDVWTSVVTGQSGTHTLVGGNAASGGSNYGFNTDMAGVLIPKTGRILAMDYEFTKIDYNNADGVMDDSTKLLTGRHNRGRMVNVLYTDSSISLVERKNLLPPVSPKPPTQEFLSFLNQ